MATLRKPSFLFLILLILGAGGCSQTEVSEQKQPTAEQKQPTIEELFQSAEEGDAEAQNYLAWMYRSGQGVPLCPVKVLHSPREARWILCFRGYKHYISKPYL